MKVELVNSFTFVRDIATVISFKKKATEKEWGIFTRQVVSLENVAIRNTERSRSKGAVWHWKRAYSYSERHGPLKWKRRGG
jgi:hypothetical protein